MTDENETEYNRFELNIQLGDGIDQRGDIEVELCREATGGEERTVEIPAGDGEMKYAQTTVEDETFAEFYMEVQRGVELLREVVGIEKGEEGGA